MDNILFSKMVGAGTRVYYIDVRQDSKANPYVSISELPTERTPGKKKKKRQRIFIHADNINRVMQALNEAFAYLNVSKC
ncbi:MAG: PUR family DNA/RNA-binding protein [Muribaculaceae bacterium]|nr:PUR family DNA/RNA-binding protein [Muribaculaceae bacterium]